MIDTYASKKFWFAVGAVVVSTGFALLAASWLPTLQPLYDIFTDTLIAITGLYLTGNVANKLVAAKLPALKPKAKTEPSKTSDDE